MFVYIFAFRQTSHKRISLFLTTHTYSHNVCVNERERVKERSLGYENYNSVADINIQICKREGEQERVCVCDSEGSVEV